ncbi:MAG: DMT family transporter [Burkholderiaceae bacterium]
MTAAHAVPPQGRALWVGTACYLFAAVSWGMNIPLTTVLFRTIDPFALAPLRVAAAAAVLAAIALLTTGPGALRLPIRAGRLALMTLAMASFFSLYNLGLLYTNTITAAALMAGGPVYSAVTLRLATGQRLEPGFWGAAVLTLLGGGIAVWGRASDSGQGLVLQGGEPLIVLSFACWTLYSVFAQRWFDPQVTQIRRTFAALAGSVAWLLVVWCGVLAAGIVAPPSRAPDGQALAFFAITAVFSTALGPFAWNIGVARVGLAMGTLWQNTVPVWGVLVSMLFGIVPTAPQAAGGAMVIAGVLYMQWRRIRALPAP